MMPIIDDLTNLPMLPSDQIRAYIAADLGIAPHELIA